MKRKITEPQKNEELNALLKMQKIKLIKQMIRIPCWGPRLFIWLPSNSDTLSELFGATSLMY